MSIFFNIVGYMSPTIVTKIYLRLFFNNISNIIVSSRIKFKYILYNKRIYAYIYILCSRTKKVTSEEIVKAYIERCKEVNDLINAVVECRYLDAIEEAKAVDAMIEKGVDLEKIRITQPFLGVPFTTKESNRVKGIRHM